MNKGKLFAFKNNNHLLILLLQSLFYHIYYILFFTLDRVSIFFRYPRLRILPLLILIVLIYICKWLLISAKGISYHGRCAGKNVKIIKVQCECAEGNRKNNDKKVQGQHF